MKLCSIEGCTKPSKARRFCDAHWARWARHGDPLGGKATPIPRIGVCSIPGCMAAVECQGLCSAHYSRLKRHGDPLGGRQTFKRATREFLKRATEYEGDECRLWPFGTSHGYACINIRGEPTRLVSRILCERVHGQPLEVNMEAAHSCGVAACVNPRHIRWASRAENEADKLRHGTRSRGAEVPGAKLVEADVRVIRASPLRTAELARIFGLSHTTVSAIRRRKSWRHVAP
jgi:hypothetical protein